MQGLSVDTGKRSADVVVNAAETRDTCRTPAPNGVRRVRDRNSCLIATIDGSAPRQHVLSADDAVVVTRFDSAGQPGYCGGGDLRRDVAPRVDGMNADNPFDPSLWQPGRRLRADRHHLPPARRRRSPQPTVRVAFDRPEVRNAFRPHTVDELYRVLDHARMSPDVGVVLLTGNGPRPKDGGWAFCSGGDQRIRGRTRLPVRIGRDRRDGRPGARRPAAHPRGAAADPVHAEGRHLPGQRLGGRRRAQPARGVRPDAGQPRARPLQADRRRRRQLRRRLRQRVSGQAGRPEVRPRDLLPRPALHRRADARDGCGQRGRRPRRAGDRRRSSGPRTINGKSPQAHPDAQVRVQPDRRRAGGPAAVRR